MVVVECVDLASGSSMEFGGEGGSEFTGCCTLFTMMDGVFRSNCCTVPPLPKVNRIAPGPHKARPLTCSSVGMLSDVTCLVLTSHESVCLLKKKEVKVSLFVDY